MSKFMDWVDARFPATKMWEDHLSKYYAPKNFNFFYFFGSLALLVLVNQIVTGVWLTMSYTPSGLLEPTSCRARMCSTTRPRITIGKATTCRAKKRFRVIPEIR